MAQAILFWFSLQNNFQGQTIVAGSLKVSSTDFGVNDNGGTNQNLVVTFLNNNLTTAKTGTLTFSGKYMLSGDVTHTYDLAPITIQVSMDANTTPATPISNNIISLTTNYTYLKDISIELSGTNPSGGTPTLGYQYEWEVTGDLGILYNNFVNVTLLSQSLNTYKFNIYNNTSQLPFSKSQTPGTRYIRRKITSGDQISYSNTITLPQPTYTGSAIQVKILPEKDKYVVGDIVNVQIENPTPNVTYWVYHMHIVNGNNYYGDEFIGSGTQLSHKIQPPFAIIGQLEVIKVYGSDGSISYYPFRVVGSN